MAKKRYRETYTYKCTLTNETFELTNRTKDTENLISVKAWYDLNPDKDDRPEVVKRAVTKAAEAEAEAEAETEAEG